MLLVTENDHSTRTPDDVCAEREFSAQLDLRLMASDPRANELPFVVCRGTPEALRFLAELLMAVADSKKFPARFHLSPNAAGRFHFSDSVDVGLYIECTRPADASLE